MKRFVAPVALGLAILLAVAALVISSLVLYGLLEVRQATLTALAEARVALSELNDYTIETTIPLNHSFPIYTEVPLEEEFLVPIQTTLPLSTVVYVPVEIPVLGTYSVSVPVQAEIPVDLQVVIPVNTTITVDTAVEVDTQVPVQLDIGQVGLEGLLAQIDRALAGVERSLQVPFESD